LRDSGIAQLRRLAWTVNACNPRSSKAWSPASATAAHFDRDSRGHAS